MNNETSNIIAVAIGTMVIAALILGWPTQLLWNYCLAPAVDGIKEIGFWQAIGLNVLASILFKSNSTKSSK